MLQTVLGFDAAAIASAFLVSPAAMSQRLVRAKSKIREAASPFARRNAKTWPSACLLRRTRSMPPMPRLVRSGGHRCLRARNGGRSDLAGTAGGDAAAAGSRSAGVACVDASTPMPAAPRAAMPMVSSCPCWNRIRADGRGDDDRSRDAAPRRRAGRHRALSIGSRRCSPAHAMRALKGEADLAAIVTLYDALWTMTGSAVIAINRAVAIAETEGAQAGLAALEQPLDFKAPVAISTHWSARAHLLAKTGAVGEAASPMTRPSALRSSRHPPLPAGPAKRA